MDSMKIPDQKAIEEARRFAQSPQGQKLIAALQQSASTDLQQAFSAQSSSDPEALRRQMNTLLSSPQIRQILEKMEQNHG